MRKMGWIAVLSVVLSPVALPAQEYTIKLAKPGPGDQFQVKTDNHTDVEFKLLDAGGNAVMEKKEAKTHHFVFREVVLQRDALGKEIVSVKRTYKKAARSLNDDRRTLPFQGETVLIEKKGDGFTFTMEGGDAIEDGDAKELSEEFNKGGVAKLLESFLPRKAVKLNEAWPLDVGPVVKEFTKDGKIEIDADKSTGSAKLTKVYQKNGKQFGVLELTIALPVTHLNHDGNRTATKKGQIGIKLESDGRIDGGVDQSQLKVTFDGAIQADINANGMDFALDITINGKVDALRVPVNK